MDCLFSSMHNRNRTKVTGHTLNLKTGFKCSWMFVLSKQWRVYLAAYMAALSSLFFFVVIIALSSAGVFLVQCWYYFCPKSA